MFSRKRLLSLSSVEIGQLFYTIWNFSNINDEHRSLLYYWSQRRSEYLNCSIAKAQIVQKCLSCSYEWRLQITTSKQSYFCLEQFISFIVNYGYFWLLMFLLTLHSNQLPKIITVINCELIFFCSKTRFDISSFQYSYFVFSHFYPQCTSTLYFCILPLKKLKILQTQRTAT